MTAATGNVRRQHDAALHLQGDEVMKVWARLRAQGRITLKQICVPLELACALLDAGNEGCVVSNAGNTPLTMHSAEVA